MEISISTQRGQKVLSKRVLRGIVVSVQGARTTDHFTTLGRIGEFLAKANAQGFVQFETISKFTESVNIRYVSNIVEINILEITATSVPWNYNFPAHNKLYKDGQCFMEYFNILNETDVAITEDSRSASDLRVDKGNATSIYKTPYFDLIND